MVGANTRRVGLFLAAIILGIAASQIPFPGLSLAGQITLGIFITAAILWITEAVPLFITSFVILFSEVVFLGLPGGALGLAAGDYAIFFAPFFDPIIALFFGGFVLGIAMSRHQLDSITAQEILHRVGNRPPWILAGFMGTTAFLSLWLSNTATTVLMIAVLMPILRMMPAHAPFRKALVLGIPFAANIGGIGTPIGTPPNAIAIANLARAGFRISFLEWMVLTIPVMLVILALTWGLLLLFFPSETRSLTLRLPATQPLNRTSWLVVAVFLITVTLWLTTPWHGIPEGAIALIPAVAFFGTGILETRDLGQVGWDVLFIVGGGLALGVAMDQSGLSSWIVSQINLAGLNFISIVLILGGVAALMTTFISNSATAALLIPIIVGLEDISPVPVTIAVALAASMSMTLPISTPPNAIAYGTGEIRTSDMIRVGGLITVASVLLVAVAATTYWSILGLR
ncbi:MAG: SLC13 family permease [Chloroflexota bacterium]